MMRSAFLLSSKMSNVDTNCRKYRSHFDFWSKFCGGYDDPGSPAHHKANPNVEVAE